MFEHKHPLTLIDLWAEQLQHEEESKEEDEEYEEENVDELIAKQDFRCLCFLCGEEICWLHRYYYTCSECDFSIHKFCKELPETLEVIRHNHILYLVQRYVGWKCNICRSHHEPHHLRYRCQECDFDVDLKCATKMLQTNVIHHPSHKHPLVPLPRQLLYKCDACGKEHKGIFYQCTKCYGPFIHSQCASLPKKLKIQHTTDNIFSHIHPLTLSYFFSITHQEKKNYPKCRVCRNFFQPDLWMYKCENCRYYTHLDCATSRNEPFMSILRSPGTGRLLKNYEDAKHPDLLHLPFPDPSYSLLKHLFFKEDGYEVNIKHISHERHPLVLENTKSPNSTRIKSIAYHDPMKRIELLCNGCLRPIMSGPVYVCANEVEEKEHCNFVLHEWCSRLPIKRDDHPNHPQHTLILHPKVLGEFFGVFYCAICYLPCNGFAYCCEKCEYYIDVNCAFLPEEVTHNSHPNHLLLCDNRGRYYRCHTCDDFDISMREALLIPEKITNKCDKHPMKLSYFPIENHKSDYFCEICEEELDPEYRFYHCHECMQSIHAACAPSILCYETHTSSYYSKHIYYYLNVKFGGTYDNKKVHQHPLSFVQGIESDGECHECGNQLQYNMIFKCTSKCKFAVHYYCCERLAKGMFGSPYLSSL